MAEKRKLRLGEILREMGLVSEEDVTRALKAGKESGLRVGEALIELGILTEDRMLWALAEQLGLSFIRIAPDQINEAAVRLIPEDMARSRLVLPLIQIGPELTLAVNDPLQDELFEDVARLSGCEVHLSLARAEEIVDGLNQVYGKAAEAEFEPESSLSSDRYPDKELSYMAADKGASRLLERLLKDCLENNVNAVHLKIRGGKAQVMFREEGVMKVVLEMGAGWGRAILTRLSLMTGESREIGSSRSWRIEAQVEGSALGLDVSRLQVRGGEAALIRVLGKRAKKMPVNKLGLTPTQRGLIEGMLATPGLIVVTGPGDSGRATTVASLLGGFDPASSRIVTAEDWIRTEDPGVLQVASETLPKGESKVRALTSLDPDVLYIESLETAGEMEWALRAGMRGAFIFTLLDFRRAASALNYLAGLGIHPSLVAEGLSGVVAQRLVRVLCDKCKSEVKLKKSQLAGFDGVVTEVLTSGPVYKTKGCKACGGTGYKGRAAAFEVLALDHRLREAVASGISVAGLPMDYGKPDLELPHRVLELIKKGVCGWEEILPFR